MTEALFVLLGAYLAIGTLTVSDMYDDGKPFVHAAARGIIWPIVFIWRIGKVLVQSLKEVGS